MKIPMRIFWLFSVLMGWLAIAIAASAQDAPVSARLLPGWTAADGVQMIGVELTLSPGWKTYWRAPGDAGIPPQFDWGGSKNIRTAEVLWPTPEVIFLQGMRSIVYKGRVVLPVRITPMDPSAPLSLRLGLDIGVCRDVCMPHQERLAQVVQDTGGTPVPAIAAAIASQPFTAREAGLRGAKCSLSATPDGLRLTARMLLPRAGTTEDVVVETGMPDIWVSEPETQRSGDTLIATALLVGSQDGAIAIDRNQLRITVLGSTHAVDIQGCARG